MKLTTKSLSAAILFSSLNPFAVQAVTLPVQADAHLADTNAGGAFAVNVRPPAKGCRPEI